MSKPASRNARALRSSIALHQMKSSMSGWSTSRMTIFAARLAARFDRAGRRVGASHEADRPRRGAAAPEVLLRRADPRQVDARPRTALEDDAFLPVPVEDRVHRVVDREDETRARLRGHALDAD